MYLLDYLNYLKKTLDNILYIMRHAVDTKPVTSKFM
ncbi:MAG: hypothetical protein ACI9VM_000668 [Candidatus Azotimanducaceae bacterium]|jgi:hypothetical protein